MRCVSETLYFGRNIGGSGRPDSAQVTADEWRVYADSVLTRWIPEGSTTTDAEGRYMDNGQSVAESTKVVTVVHRPGLGATAGVDSAIALYLRRFKQRSVGRVRTRVSSDLCD
jgi:hypothetical protein